MENKKNPNDELKHRINTSDSKDYSKAKQRDDIKKTVIINFSIIREVFNIINFSKFIKMSDFYFYLYTQNASMKDIENLAKIDDCADLDPADKIRKIYRYVQRDYDTLIRNGSGNFERIFQTLAEYGISDKYQKGQIIIADKKIINSFKEHYLDSSQTNLTYCKEILKNNIFSVKNLDGSLVIDSMRDMLMDMLDIYDVNRNDEYALVNKITNKQPTSHLSQTQILHYYNEVVRDYIENKKKGKTEEIIVNDLPKGKVKDSNIYEKEYYQISRSLFFIREVYRLFSEIDNIPNSMDKFYGFLGVTEKEYDEMKSNGTISRKLVNKLEPYKYPASLFRADNTAQIKVCTELADAYDNLKNKKINIDEFRTLLKLDFCYKIPKENIGLALATYALIKGINDSTPSYYNTLNPDEKELYHQLVKLNSMT